MMGILLISPKLKVATQALELFKQKDTPDVQSVATVEEAIAIAQESPCIMIQFIASETEIPTCLQLCKALELQKRDPLRKLIVVSVIDNEKIKNALMIKGVNEFLNEKTTAKAIVFKANMYFAQIKKKTEATTATGRTTATKNFSAETTESKEQPVRFSSEAIADDTWILAEAIPKKIGVRWVLEIAGPDVDSGAWEPAGFNDRTEQWLWHPYNENGEKIAASHEPSWFFAGDCPVYDASLQRWKFVAKAPELFYQKDNRKLGVKIKYENGIVLAPDHPDAQKKIHASTVIGDKVRKLRERQVIEKTEIEKSGTFVAKENTSKAAGIIIQEGVKSNSHMAIEAGSKTKTQIAVQNKTEAMTKGLASQDKTEAMTKGLATQTKPDAPTKHMTANKESTPGKKNETDSKEMDPMHFFFQISEMVNSGLSYDEITDQIWDGTSRVLKTDHLFLISQGVGQHIGVILQSTSPRFVVGQTIDMDREIFGDVFDSKELKISHVDTKELVGALPIRNSTGALFALIFYFDKQKENDIAKLKPFLKTLAKQLSRFLTAATKTPAA